MAVFISSNFEQIAELNCWIFDGLIFVRFTLDLECEKTAISASFLTKIPEYRNTRITVYPYCVHGFFTISHSFKAFLGFALVDVALFSCLFRAFLPLFQRILQL